MTSSLRIRIEKQSMKYIEASSTDPNEASIGEKGSWRRYLGMQK